MAKKDRLLLRVVSLSMSLGRKYMSSYSHNQAPKKFTQPQLFTCLILRMYLKTTYRGIIEYLEVAGELRKVMGLTQLPHYSTLKRFSDRSNVQAIVDALLAEIIAAFADDETEVAIDSTGLETTSASAHFKTRSGRKRKQYVKVSVSVTCEKMLPIGVVIDWGPRNDKAEAPELLQKTAAVILPKTLFADAGYDAEWIHQFCRNDWGVRSWIPPAVHRKDGQIGGQYRSKMTEKALKHNGYGRRWIVESFMSGLKRTTGSALNARLEQSLFNEAALRVLAYAIKR
jgi:hypothetical protein